MLTDAEWSYLRDRASRLARSSGKIGLHTRLAVGFDFAKRYMTEHGIRCGEICTETCHDYNGQIRVLHYIDTGPFEQTLIHDAFLGKWKVANIEAFKLKISEKKRYE